MSTLSPASRTATSVLRAAATLVVLGLAWQFVTAGQLLPRGGAIEPHAVGAIVLHVLAGLAVLAAFGHRRTTGAPWWPTVLAAVVFVLSFVQAWAGDEGLLAVHVPGAIVLTVGAVWLAAWAWLGRGATTAHDVPERTPSESGRR